MSHPQAPLTARARTRCRPCSQHELMQQLETTSGELHGALERLRGAEAERLGAVRAAEELRARLAEGASDRDALRTTLLQRCVCVRLGNWLSRRRQ